VELYANIHIIFGLIYILKYPTIHAKLKLIAFSSAMNVYVEYTQELYPNVQVNRLIF